MKPSELFFFKDKKFRCVIIFPKACNKKFQRANATDVNCFVLRSYPFKDNVYTILLPTVGCFAPLPPPLNAHALPILPQ